MMKFFKDPKNWKQEISGIGLTAGFMLFLLSFLVLGNPNIWLLFSCIPLLVPLIFGSWWKMKLPALLLIVISAGIIGSTIYWQRRPISLNSPDDKSTAVLFRRGNGNCYTVKIDEQIFYTKASISDVAVRVFRMLLKILNGIHYDGNACLVISPQQGCTIGNDYVLAF